MNPRIALQPQRIRADRDVFVGEILGVGTAAGTRIVVGIWSVSPYGAFADVMIEGCDGHRTLLAPTQEVAEYVAGIYTFDEVLLTPVDIERGADRVDVVAGSLRLSVRLGGRTPIGRLLRLVPEVVGARTWFSRLCDPIARVVLPGVRTHGSAGGGRREFYGAHDVHAVQSVEASWQQRTLGSLAPVDPPPRFGFASTPRTPALTRLTTTVVPGAEPTRTRTASAPGAAKP